MSNKLPKSYQASAVSWFVYTSRWDCLYLTCSQYSMTKKMDSRRGPTATSVTLTIFWCLILFKMLISLKLDTGMPSVSRSILIFFRATICFVFLSTTRLYTNVRENLPASVSCWRTIQHRRCLLQLDSVSQNPPHLCIFQRKATLCNRLLSLWQLSVWWYEALIVVIRPSIVCCIWTKEKMQIALAKNCNGVLNTLHKPLLTLPHCSCWVYACFQIGSMYGERVAL